MCRIVEEYAEEYAKKCVEKILVEEIIKTGIAFGVSKDKIINRLQERMDLSEEEALKKYDLYK